MERVPSVPGPAGSAEQLICIGTITAGSVRVEYLHGLITAISTPESRVGRVLIEPYGPYLDDARNQVVASFLADTRLDYLLFIDSDIYFSVDDIVTLLAHQPHRDAIMSGAYRTERDGSYVVAGDRDESGVIQLMTLDEFDRHDLATPVDGVGAGFLLIPRHVLVQMGETFGAPCPWFHEPVDEHGVHLGEDYGFCDRASKLGYPIHLDPSVRLAHVKTIGLTL